MLQTINNFTNIRKSMKSSSSEHLMFWHQNGRQEIFFMKISIFFERNYISWMKSKYLENP